MVTCHMGYGREFGIRASRETRRLKLKRRYLRLPETRDQREREREREIVRERERERRGTKAKRAPLF